MSTDKGITIVDCAWLNLADGIHRLAASRDERGAMISLHLTGRTHPTRTSAVSILDLHLTPDEARWLAERLAARGGKAHRAIDESP